MKTAAMENKGIDPGYYLLGMVTGVWHWFNYLPHVHLLNINWFSAFENLLGSGLTAGFSAICVKVFVVLWRIITRSFNSFFKRKK